MACLWSGEAEGPEMRDSFPPSERWEKNELQVTSSMSTADDLMWLDVCFLATGCARQHLSGFKQHFYGRV